MLTCPALSCYNIADAVSKPAASPWALQAKYICSAAVQTDEATGYLLELLLC
jgi:hypothetical protein